jgi:hypothetical protein
VDDQEKQDARAIKAICEIVGIHFPIVSIRIISIVGDFAAETEVVFKPFNTYQPKNQG